MKFIIAKKLEMSQRFLEDGTVVPVTVLKAEPCVVTQVKTVEKDGYAAVQIGCGEKKRPTKALAGHLKKAGRNARVLREFVPSEGEFNVGDTVDVSSFSVGEFVQVMGVTKGKGFQGVVKRHGFRGGPASHGHKDNLRMPGSIGAGGVQRVFKGTRMAGRMGGTQQTTKNLKVVDVDAKNGTIALSGAVPGARGAIIEISGGYDKKQSWN